MSANRTGAEAFCDALERAGVDCIFGLPGTQTVELFDALRSSGIRAIVPTHELAAAFMAIGYARASGKPGVLLTISGPGVAFTAAGLTEAQLDGVPVVLFTIAPAVGPTGEPAFQAFDQAAFARPITKAALRADDRAQVAGVVRDALALAAAADPGPVFVEFSSRALHERGDDVSPRPSTVTPPSGDAGSAALDDVLRSLADAKHPVLFVACDCDESSDLVASVAAAARLPVLVPSPHRGVVAEDHPWMLCCDDQRTQFAQIQELVSTSDLVVVVGTGLTHVATSGFRLRFPPERVVCVSESGARLPHGYSARTTAAVSPRTFLTRAASLAQGFASTWSTRELSQWQQRFAAAKPSDPPEPTISGGTPAEFFAALRAALPRDVILVTDSGLHQALARRHYPVLGRRGLVFPSDFQSMGFGLPAALGAKLAQPERGVVVVMGDGGFLMSGLDLLTASRDAIPVVVIVLNDGRLNLIRLQQLREYGRSYGVDLLVPDLEQFARAAAVRYRTAEKLPEVIREALSAGEPTLVEVLVGDSWSITGVKAKSVARETVRRAIGEQAVSWLKRRLR
jgi:acetolactate synthase I/II/III large subunit